MVKIYMWERGEVVRRFGEIEDIGYVEGVEMVDFRGWNDARRAALDNLRMGADRKELEVVYKLMVGEIKIRGIDYAIAHGIGAKIKPPTNPQT